jgi:hypothetical protein
MLLIAAAVRTRVCTVSLLQATLKLSGHLINARGWNGRLMLAAKNSADNAFTAAAELLLAQMLGVSLHS